MCVTVKVRLAAYSTDAMILQLKSRAAAAAAASGENVHLSQNEQRRIGEFNGRYSLLNLPFNSAPCRLLSTTVDLRKTEKKTKAAAEND